MMVFCGFREPGYLWKLPIPFFWGPLGGVQNYPWRFLWQAGIRGAFSEGTRSIVNALQLRLSRRVRKAIRRSVVVMAANSATGRKLKKIFGVEPVVQLETGLPDIGEKTVAKENGTAVLKILWSGLFEHRKALQLLLCALAHVPASVQYELHVLGKGPLEKRWKNFADALGIADRVKWLGWLPHEEALAQYDWAHVFVFTSLRDTTGTVVLESLSHGTPVICLDHQGAADIVTNECGIKVPVTSPATTIAGIRDALTQLHDDKERRKALSSGASVRAREFLWQNQAERMKEMYETTLTIETLAAA
jgi:glycosyltransferase involved in cell wall biosynthesis